MTGPERIYGAKTELCPTCQGITTIAKLPRYNWRHTFILCLLTGLVVAIIMKLTAKL